MSRIRVAFGVFLFLNAFVLIPSRSSAQAWVDSKDSLTAGASYNYTKSSDHLFSDSFLDGKDLGKSNGGPDYPAGKHVVKNKRVNLGDSYFHTLFLHADYVPMDNLGVTLGIPYVYSKYDGPLPPHGPADDGDWHLQLQDLSLNVRYMFDIPGIIVVTPFVAYGTPLSDYDTAGHASIGTHLQEGTVGTYVGRYFDPFLPKAYFQARYSRTWVERPKKYPKGSDRNNWGLDLGYQVMDPLSARVFVDGRTGLQGVNWTTGINKADPDSVHTHDQLSKTSWLIVGAGANYQLDEALGVNVAFSQMLSGANVMQTTSYTLGATWHTPKAGLMN